MSLLSVLLAIQLSLTCQMRDLHFKIEEDRTKTAVAIENDRYFGRTDKINTQVILYLSIAVNCIGQTTGLFVGTVVNELEYLNYSGRRKDAEIWS